MAEESTYVARSPVVIRSAFVAAQTRQYRRRRLGPGCRTQRGGQAVQRVLSRGHLSGGAKSIEWVVGDRAEDGDRTSSIGDLERLAGFDPP